MALELWTELSKPVSKSDALEVMQSLGLHVMRTEWAQLAVGTGRVYSTSLRRLTMKVHGSDEELTIPVQTCTTVQDVKAMLSERLMIPASQMTFVYKQGFSYRIHRDREQIGSKITVKGIRSFKAARHEWPYPLGILGAGYYGIKSGVKWLNEGSSNFVVLDRLDRVGGYCWLRAANKRSRLQTEFATFNVWYGPEFVSDPRCIRAAESEEWGTWPDRDAILRHFQVVAEEYGLLAHCRFSVSVNALDVIGRKNGHERHYSLALSSTASADGAGEREDLRVSGLLSCPGSLTCPRIVEFPGEDVFSGHIGYGMGDGVPYDALAGSRTAIIGNGAFATENVRICCECGVAKVYVICRRQNLVCPRLSCWFMHQAPLPVPGVLLLRQFEPMYKLAGLGDPFNYPAIHGSRSSPSILINQPTRLPTSDAIFLASAMGVLKYVEASVKRLTADELHLTQEGKLSNIQNLIKATGYTGDASVDKLHGLRELKGYWPDGDYRRPIRIDPPSIHASNFDSISQGLPSYFVMHQDKFFFDFPREYQHAVERGLPDMLPVNVAKEDRPVYLHDIRHSMMTMNTVSAMCPKLLRMTLGINKYKRESMRKTHPLKEYLQLCRKEWDELQQRPQVEGGPRKHIPYPITESMVETWLEEHKAAAGNRTADDAALATLSAREDEQGYYAASRQWWTRNYGEAGVAWRTAKVTMSASKRANSAG